MNSKWFIPNSNGGKYIYIVIKYDNLDQFNGIKTQVEVNWGSYSRREDIASPTIAIGVPDGFVIRLKYKGGTYPIDIRSSGIIQDVRQGTEPMEWNQFSYKQYKW